MEDTPHPLNTIDFTKTLKKAVNDKYIELLQIGFRLGHNQPIDTLLEDPNLYYILDNRQSDITRNEIKKTGTAIVEWLGGPIPEHATLEEIK